MGTLMLESFIALGSAANFGTKHPGGSASGSIVTGRWGAASKGIGLDSGGAAAALYPFTSRSEIFVGGAFNPPGSASTIFRFYSGGSTVQGSVVLNSNGSLSLYRGNTAALLVTSDIGLVTSTNWNYYEVRYKPHTSAGEFEVQVNGVHVPSLDFTGNTAASGSVIDMVGWITAGSGSNVWTDLYVTDDRFLGDTQVHCVMATAEGNSSQLTPLSGTDNALMVDELTPDDDTTYVAGDTVGEKDTYVVANLPAGVTDIHAVQVSLRARKSDAGTRAIKAVVRHGGTDYVSTEEKVLSTTYEGLRVIYDENPGTAAAWTPSEVDGAEFGVEVSQ